jgi:hypothetical protein
VIAHLYYEELVDGIFVGSATRPCFQGKRTLVSLLLGGASAISAVDTFRHYFSSHRCVGQEKSDLLCSKEGIYSLARRDVWEEKEYRAS